MNEILLMPVSSLPGVGPARAALLEKGGIRTLGELLETFPREYLNQTDTVSVSSLVPGESQAVRVRILSAPMNRHVRGYTITQAMAGDETGRLRLAWFNQPYMVRSLAVGAEYLARGRVKLSGSTLELSAPRMQRLEDGSLRPFAPVYPLWNGMTQKLLSSLIEKALEKASPLADYLPARILEEERLPDYASALRAIHLPETASEAETARSRLAFDELFIRQLALLRQKAAGRLLNEAARIEVSDRETEAFIGSFPFAPTGAQRRAWEDIRADLASSGQMNRLVQGDVGCGKTWVALMALWATAKSGFQGAMMAPTEVLARQHYEELCRVLEPAGIRVGLLCGSLKASERKKLYEELENGTVSVAVGTHALISEGVSFHRLGLVITDEQHRFGVRQRLLLSQKGLGVNVLIMTATPIPRTLSMTLYGDMDVSLIDELPPGRTPVRTYCVSSAYTERLQAFMKKQMQAGHQVYLICPAVGENEETELASAEKLYRTLSGKVFPDFSVGLLHGQLRPEEKDRVMEDFVSGRISLLVSTTVVEVGVNVPNATLMIIENAERFGLAQLHQLRGRVGRGSEESFCVLKSDSEEPQTVERLRVLCESNDGFYIAEQDLKLRGGGDLFGLRQHGLPELKLADPVNDRELLLASNRQARRLTEEDPFLLLPEHAELKARLESFIAHSVLSA